MHTPNTPLNEADLSVNGLLTRASNIRPEQSTSDSQKGRQDDDIAVALSGHGNIPLRRTVSVGHSSGDRARLSRASCHTTVSNSRWSMVQQRLGTAKGRRLSSLSPALPTGHDCILCKYPIHGQEVKAPCGDYYDTLCVLKLFEAAARDESLFPPTCCRQRIPLHDVQPYMDATLLAQHKEKSKEYKTVKRIYCANPTCSRFLGPQSEGLLSWIRPSRRCPTSGCSTTTCMRCRARVQPHGHHCVDDEQEREVLALAKEAGWTRCPRCNQMIELDGGCFHMTCRCKAEFCYLCRSTWKTCSCCQWDDQRAAVAAGMWEDRIARTLPAPPAATAHFPTHKSKLGKSSRKSFASSEGSTVVTLPNACQSSADSGSMKSKGSSSIDASDTAVLSSADASSDDSSSTVHVTPSATPSIDPVAVPNSRRISVSNWLDGLQSTH